MNLSYDFATPMERTLANLAFVRSKARLAKKAGNAVLFGMCVKMLTRRVALDCRLIQHNLYKKPPIEPRLVHIKVNDNVELVFPVEIT